jgi:DNA-binding NtrC family response regulator
MRTPAVYDTETEADSRSPRAAADAKTSPYLFVVLHCDEPLLGGARYSLERTSEVVIARGAARHAAREETREGRTLVVSLPGSFMSRVHARVTRAAGAWLLVDEDAKNGTFVNGERVTKATLADGDVIECGHTLLIFRAGLQRDPELSPDRDQASAAGPLHTLVPELEHRHVLLTRMAASTLPILLLGETGTGKEVAARAVHALSGRSGPFVAVNCGALPPTLLESQLFGHVKGAFSGATRDEPGYFRAAERGTLLLDEIGELSPTSQAAFLRATEEHLVTPVGSTRALPVDVRVIAATNRPLAQLVEVGTFRRDLFARLSAFTHRLLPLRERKEDIGVLLASLFPDLEAIEVDAANDLLGYDWPLNVRELRQIVASARVLGGGAPIGRAHVNPVVREAAEPSGGELRTRLVAELERSKGNVAAVARVFGKAPTQVHRWIRRFGLDLNRFRA